MNVTVSVPGKVHLMGEHAVVYGKPALLAAIDMRMRVTVEPSKKQIEIHSSEPREYVEHIVSLVCKQYDIASPPNVRISIESNIPAGFHLGSSAATAVGCVGALTYYLKKLWNPQAINQLAYEAEKFMHGNPSGGDNTVISMGGFIWFRKELEFLKSMWQLPVHFPHELNHFYLIDTGRPEETTKEMIGFVAGAMKKQKEKYRKLFDMNETQTKRIAVALKEKNEVEFMDAIKAGEKSLEGMGVVSKSVVPIIRTIEIAGGAAKILGGGGREAGVGFLLAYHTDKTAIESIGKNVGFSIHAVTLGAEGVRLESK
jgi:mevalonate kinase